MAVSPGRSVTHRVAVHLGGELGNRLNRVLSSESDVEVISLEGQDWSAIRPDWAVLVLSSLSDTNLPLTRSTLECGGSVVVGSPLPPGFSTSGGVLVGDAIGRARLVSAVAMAALPPNSQVLGARLAWTVEDKPLASGKPITFPEPVGPLWAAWADGHLPWPDTTYHPAPTLSEWDGIRVEVRFVESGTERHLVRGVVDHRGFLDAVCLGAAVRAAVRGAYKPGVTHGPADSQGVFLNRAQSLGLRIAEFVPA